MTAYAVWYASAGCLPDSEYPEHICGSLGAAEAWIRANQSEYARPWVQHDLYELQIDIYELTG